MRSLTTIHQSHAARVAKGGPSKAWSQRTALGLVGLTLLGMLVAGYHPGTEDGGVYLAAIQRRLDPSLFRVDADFFNVRLQATIFVRFMAWMVRSTHVPLAAMQLFWHVLTIFAILAACYRIAARCFEHEYARWCGVALVSVLFTMPVSATALYIVDQYLVPRAMATALGLFAIDAVLGKRLVLAVVLAAVSFVFHPVIATFGISLGFFLAVPWPLSGTGRPWMAALAIPIGFLFDTGPVPPALHAAIHKHPYCVLARWAWYEWLGVVAPVFLLLWFGRLAGRRAQSGRHRMLEHVATRTAAYGTFQLAVALLIMLPPALERMRPLEPMRYLHLLYLMMILLGGGLVGEYFLQRHGWRWAALFVPMALGMFVAQRALFPASPHLELPGVGSSNPWTQSFEWVRNHTPEDAYFALGPDYMRRPGENYQGFRGLALRSALADNAKDSGTVMTSAALAERWQREVAAQNAGHADWQHVSVDDLRRLKAEFGVNWAIVERPTSIALDCPYQNDQLAVCRID